MKNFISTHGPRLLLLLLIPLIISINLFLRGYVFGGAEEGLPFYNIKNTLAVYSDIWVDQVPGFPLIFEVGKIPFLLLLLVISTIFSSPVFISSLFVFLLMSIGITGMYALVLFMLQGNTSRKGIALLSALFYLLNPFSMAQVWGRHLSMQMYPFALIPGFLFLLFYGLQHRKFIFAALAILLSVFLSGAFNHPSYVITLFSVVLWYVIFYLYHYKKDRIYTIWYVIRAGALFVFANSLWLLPYLVQLKEPNDFIGNRENLSILMGLSQYFPLSTILTLKQKYYFNMVEAFGSNYNTPIFMLLALLLPFILILGFTQVKNMYKPHRLFIIAGFTFSLFICAGGNRPFGPIILWLMNHISILEIYRNTYEKFGLIFTIFYSVLFGIGLHSVYHFFAKRHLKLFFFPLLLILFFLYVLPLWNGTAFQQADATNELPEYYQNFVKWAQSNQSDSRILITPIMNGDATTQKWGEKEYRGIDISPFILNSGTLTREIPGLPGNEFTAMLRKRIQQQDVSEVLKALRIKYIVNRGDMVINQAFLNHINYLTKETYAPSNYPTDICPIPNNTHLTTNLFFSCTPLSSDLTKTRFIRVGLKSNTKVMIETRLLDINGLRTRWDGKTEKDYLIDQNTNELVLPIGIETELPSHFSYSNVVAVEISYFPIDGYPNPTVLLSSIKMDKGSVIPLHKYALTKQFGPLQAYETQDIVFNEVRSPKKITVVPNLLTFFTQYKANDNESYLVNDKLPMFDTSVNELTHYEKISSTQYRVNFKTTDQAYLWLAKNMNSSWKVVPGDIKNDFDIMKATFVSEKNHYTADGYANMWIVQGNKKYTIVYLPAVYVRIGGYVTVASLAFLLLYVGFTFMKSRQYMLK